MNFFSIAALIKFLHLSATAQEQASDNYNINLIYIMVVIKFPFQLLCLTGGIAIFSSTIAKNPVLPIFASEIGADISSIGLIAAASTIIGIIISFPAGIFSDYQGRKPLLLTAGIVFLTAPLAYFFVCNSWQLAIVRLYHGIATAILSPVAMAYITDLSVTRRGEQLGWYASTTLAGRAIAPVVGGILLQFGSWQWVYGLSAISGAIACIAISFVPNLESTEEKKQPSGNFSTVVKEPTIIITSIAEAAQFLAFGAIEAFLPLYALSIGIDKAIVGMLFGVQVGIKTIARVIMGKISDRYGRKLQILIGLIVSAIATALFTQTEIVILLFVISALFGLGISIATAATSAFVADISPESSRGTALGLMSSIMDIGQATGPILLGFVLMRFSFQTGFLAIAVIVMLSSLLFAMIATEKSDSIDQKV